MDRRRQRLATPIPQRLFERVWKGSFGWRARPSLVSADARRARLSIRKLHDVLRLRAARLSSRQVGASLGIGPSTVVASLGHAQRAGFDWPLPDDLTDEVLETRLFPSPVRSRSRQ